MEITVSERTVYVELSEFGWTGAVNRVGNFQAATLGDLIDLIKITLERI